MITPRIRRTENLHILLWLIKDLCWVQDYKVTGVLMIVPTIAVAVFLTVRTRKQREEFIHNLAVVFWLCANSVWMIGEFFYNDSVRPVAVLFFVLGLVTLAVHYVPKWTGHKSEVKSHKSQVTSHKSQVTSYKLQVTSYKLQGTRYESQDKKE